MSNLAVISENKEAFSLLLQAKRDLRHEAICLFSNLNTVWKHLPAEMQDDAKIHILHSIVEKGLLELSHSSAVLDEQIDELLKGDGENFLAQQQQIRDQYRQLSDQDRILKELNEKNGRLQWKINAREQALKQKESELSIIKREISGIVTELNEDRISFFTKISIKDIASKLKKLVET